MFKMEFLAVAADISCPFRIQDISLLFQQIKPILLQMGTGRCENRIGRLVHQLFHPFQPILFLLARENHVIAVQVLGDVQRHRNSFVILCILHPSYCHTLYGVFLSQCLMKRLDRLQDHRIILEAVHNLVVLKEPLLMICQPDKIHCSDFVLGKDEVSGSNPDSSSKKT